MNFSDYINSKDSVLLIEKANPGVFLHLTHLEDLAIEQGKQGFANFEEQVTQLLNFLMGLNSKAQLHLKVDGSPALFFGFDPRPDFKKQFFVATKSAFNVNNPKICHSVEEISATYTGQLAQKLKDALQELSKAYDGSGLIYQGDLLFSNSSEKTVQHFEGTDYITFKPNILVYAIPVDPKSELYKRINKAKLGIILHDTFSAEVINSRNAIRCRAAGKNFNRIKASGLKHDVFIEDSAYQAVNLQVSSVTKVKIRQLLLQSGTYINEISDAFDESWKTSTLLPLLKNYLNEQVRSSGSFFTKALKGENFDAKGFKTGFNVWIKERYDIESKKRKTDKGKIAVLGRRDAILQWVSVNDYDFNRLLHATYYMLQIKNELLKLVSEVESKLGKTFYQTVNGSLELAKGEGFVSFIGANQVKLVDRLDFSVKNFQKDLKPANESVLVENESILYHVTLTKNMSKILAKGLTPMQTSNWIAAASKERYGEGEIYAFENRRDALRWATKMDWDFNGGMGTEKIALITFRNHGEWEIDTASPWDYVGHEGQRFKQFTRVPPEDITAVELVGKKQVAETQIRKESVALGKTIKVGYFAGGFKPPHAGHFAVAKQAAKENNEVHIIVGPKQRPPITAETAQMVWEVFARRLPNVTVDPIAPVTPVRTAYEIIEKLNKSKKAGQYEITFYADHDDMPQYERMKNYSGNLVGLNLIETARTMSATDVRNAILRQDWDKVARHMPKEVDLPQVIRILKLAVNT